MTRLPPSIRRPLAGWGRWPVQECSTYRPEHVAAVGEIVARAPEASLLARGHGRSYGDAALNDAQGVILQERLDHVLAFDEDEDEASVRCEAAVSLGDLLEIFLPRGYAPAVTPGTRYISLGGAIAADVHGKNHHRDGTISSQLLDFSLLTAAGDVLTCSRETNPELFWATIGGMGLTGVILDARLRLRRIETSFMRVVTERAANLDAVLERMSEGDAEHAYSVAWIDCLASGRSLGRSVLMRADHALPDDLSPEARRTPLQPVGGRRFRVPFDLPQRTLNPVSMRLFNAAFYWTRQLGHRIERYEDYFYPLDAVLEWNRIYGRRGVVQYQVVIPSQTSRQALRTILERVSASGLASFLGVLKSMGAENPGPLSFPRQGITLALDFPNTGAVLLRLLAELDELVLRQGGRVYLAKDCCLRPDHFAAMYPRLAEFRAVKSRIDPQQRFSSSLARRLGIVDS